MNRKVITGFLLILIFVFAAAGYAQQVDPSIPLKIAHQYRNDFKFDDALEWYEKVINDFPENQAAAEACLNRIAIFRSQSATYAILCLDFKRLALAKLNEESNYMSTDLSLKALSEAEKFKKKADSYSLKHVQTGKKLKEEYYRFEKDYARFIEKLPIPWIPLKDEEILKVNEDNTERILTLGLVPNLEFESRIKELTKQCFENFCLFFMGFGGEVEQGVEKMPQWRAGEFTGKINQAGFYYWLGVELHKSIQFKAALLAFDKVLNLTSDSPYNKLSYESETKKQELISDWKKYLATIPAEAQEFVEKPEE